MYVSAGNMSKLCCFAFVLAVICLLLEADAQPTVDETMTCGSSTMEEVLNMVKIIGSNQQENVKEIRDVKKLLTSNPTDSITAEPSKQALVSALTSTCVPLLIQQNVDGSNFFNRSWAEFKVGFNDSSGNYWLGNDLLSQLTVSHRYKLKFDLQSRSNTSNWYWAEYSTFRVLPETYNYELLVAGYSGNAGKDALSIHHNGMMFSTYDRDNDRASSRNVALLNGGGFWYDNDVWCAVNSVRGSGHEFWWSGLPGGSQLQSSRMWLQCK